MTSIKSDGFVPSKSALIETVIGALALFVSVVWATHAHAQHSQPVDYATYFRHDVYGRVTGEIGPDPDGSGPLGFPAKRTSYDILGLKVRVEIGYLATWQPLSVATSNWTGFTIVQTENFAYDTMQRPVKSWVVGSDGATVSLTQMNTDKTGRSACTVERMNPATFGGAQPNACVLGPEGSGANANGPDRITQNHYDAAGQVLRVQKAVGTPIVQDYVSYTYTLNGKQKTVRDANGNLATYEYDEHDRLRKWIFPSKTVTGVSDFSDFEEYSYDANNNRASLRKRDGSLITFSYDALNRVSVKYVPERSGTTAAATRDVYYGYDLRGLQTYARFDSASGEGVSSEYDGFGRQIASVINMAGQSRRLEYKFDANSNRTEVKHPDGTAFGYAYDTQDRTTSAYVVGGGSIAAFAYNTEGELSGVTSGGGSSSSYLYDPVQRMKKLSQGFVGGNGNVDILFGYNPSDQIKTRDISTDTYAYRGDVNVNRPYTPNGLNQYVSAGPASFTYDANGNLTGDGSTVFTYDIENRLIEATGGRKAKLVYDPLGRLFSTSGEIANSERRFLYDGDALVGEYRTDGTLARRYVHGNEDDDPFVWYEGASLGNPLYLHVNHQGSVVALAGSNGGLDTINSYDAWGIPAKTNKGRFQYTGQAIIPELEMYHYKARIYSPTLGRFLQTDPIGYEDNVNLYGYVGNDPLSRVDPDGEDGRPVSLSRCKSQSCQERLLKSVGADRQTMQLYREARANHFWNAIGALTFFSGGGGSANGGKLAWAAYRLGGANGLRALFGMRVPISISNAQLGKKFASHFGEWGLKGGKEGVEKMRGIINDIGRNPDKVVNGFFSGGGPGGRRAAQFRIKGDDVVVTDMSNNFVTILKDGIQNGWVRSALGR